MQKPTAQNYIDLAEEVDRLRRENGLLWEELHLKRPLAEILFLRPMPQVLASVAGILRESDLPVHAVAIDQILLAINHYNKEREK